MKLNWENIQYTLWVVVSLALPWNVTVNSIGLGLLTLSGIIQSIVSKHKIINKSPDRTLLITMFILAWVGFSFEYYKESLFAIEKSLSFALVPISFLLMQDKIGRERLNNIFKYFALSCTALLLYLFIHNWIIYVSTNGPIDHIWRYSYFTNVAGIRPVYLSIYLSFSFFIIVFELVRNWKKYSRWVCLTLILFAAFISFGIFFIQARISIIGFIIVCIILLLRFLYIKYKWYALLALIPLFLILILGFNISKDHLTFNRFNTIQSALEGRLYQWEAAINVFQKSPILGAGTTTWREHIDHEYLKLGHDIGIERRYNAHNQYLHYLMAHGLIGLIVFLGIMFYGYQQAFLNKDYLLLTFMLTMSIFFLTENALSTQKGIVFFTSFYCLLIYRTK